MHFLHADPKACLDNRRRGFLVEHVDTDRTLCLVSGYHRDSYPPSRAYDQRLRRRFAVVFETYRRAKVDMYFDADLFLHLIPILCQAIGYDSCTIVLSNGVCVGTFESLANYYAGCEELDRDPPDRIDLSKDDQLVAIVETEWWALCGGPSPYHDSYTFSFYTGEDRSDELRRISETVCTQIGARITGIHTADDSKEPYRPWWGRMLPWLRDRVFGPPTD
jgi:hypothetical protein